MTIYRTVMYGALGSVTYGFYTLTRQEADRIATRINEQRRQQGVPELKTTQNEVETTTYEEYFK